MKKKNNLPESWCVKNDGSQLFKDTVIVYINNRYHRTLDGFSKMYYGYSVKHNTCIDDSSSRFENLLTLSEFIELSKEVEDWEPKFGEEVLAWDKDSTVKSKKVFIGIINNRNACVDEDSLKSFAYNSISLIPYDYVEKREEYKLTLSAIANKFNISEDHIKNIVIEGFKKL